MIRTVSPEGMRAAEQTAMAAGLSERTLMERAAQAVQARLAVMTGARPAAFVCGPGNNGADGLAAARLHAQSGGMSYALLVWPDGSSGESAAAQEALAREAGVEVRPFAAGIPADAVAVVDALFGIGLRRAPEGAFEQAIRTMNGCGRPILCVDLPSGVLAGDGTAPGAAVRGAACVTFGLCKPGHLLFPGRALCGQVNVADIGLEPYMRADGPEALDDASAAALAPKRAPDAHKGSCGHAFLLAGSPGYAGAAALCARGALRGGAGLVSVCGPEEALACVRAHAPEAICAALAPPAALAALAGRCDALAAGPGLTTSPEAHASLKAVWASGVPLVADADALNLLAAGGFEQRGGQSVFTPHPGEAARLLGQTIPQVTAEPVAASRAIAARYGAVALLKGATTVIAAPDGRMALNVTGTPGMATGGSGDVLTGVIAALLAQGLTAFDAARLGAYLHGRAGEAAAKRRSVHGMTALDIAESLGEAWLCIESLI